MSRFFPHPPYAEDQPLAKTILYTHTTTRGLQLGSLLSSTFSLSLFSLRRFGLLTPKPTSILRSTGIGALTGATLLAIATTARMWAREDIEWADRAWRLRANKGQVECDDWTYAGMVGGVLGGLGRGVRGVRGVRVVGAGGLGSVVGMGGWMGWRYIRGERDEEEEGL
ncbi:hypothetical protein GLAREA_11397 [Glarea lozoyensis ATCC 20868]|uniref:Uncharacterized protein n=1 Tax=Glarea lozoyensis (strain ATCC 20868 / MF5171) TaxID=1116229 RepID=S3CYE2_GLAL2|nr:uncharacterized protein GLAREA_11397 [Glarea lozoyensis ATCC 20868]EPE24816.1 hypothetical protein GLAREA_11397 [Glarea lozoyensis ATCC 20868]